VSSSDEDDDRGWYERWLDELAGERVRIWPIFAAWALLVLIVGGGAYWLGLRDERELIAVVAAVSVPYWFWAVPLRVSRRRERHRR
jgi:Flp pilus assembly protein TadB